MKITRLVIGAVAALAVACNPGGKRNPNLPPLLAPDAPQTEKPAPRDPPKPSPGPVLTTPAFTEGHFELPALIYGRTYTTTIAVQNNYPTEETVTISMGDLTTPGNPLKYFSVETAKVTLKPFERREIPIVITTPPLAAAPKNGESVNGMIRVLYEGDRGPDRPLQETAWHVTGRIYHQPSDETRAIDRQIGEALAIRLTEVVPTIDKTALLYDGVFKKDASAVLGALFSKDLLDSNNRPIAPTTVMALLATAEGTAANCDGLVARLDSFLAASDDERLRVGGYLRTRAVEIADTYKRLTEAQAGEDMAMQQMTQDPELYSVQASLDWSKYHQERQALQVQYDQQLSAEPLLGLTRNGELHWRALTATADASAAVTVNGTFFTAGIEQFTAKATEIRAIRSIGELEQFKGPEYAPVRLQLFQLGQQLNSDLLPYLIGELDTVGGAIEAVNAADHMELGLTVGLLAVASSLTPAGRAVSLAGDAFDTTINVLELTEVSGQLRRAETLGPVLGYSSILDLEKRREGKQISTFVSAVFGIADATETGFRVVTENKLFGLGAKAAGAATRPAVAIARVGETVTDPAAIIRRLDATSLAQGQGKLTVAAIDARLAPVATVRSADGTVFHLSEPFVGPGDRTFVYAYEELANGNVAVRVFYRSNEHGTIRLVSEGTTAGIGKGDEYFVDLESGVPLSQMTSIDPRRPVRSKYANEAAADITHDLQGSVGQWMSGRPTHSFENAELMNAAFFGPVAPSFASSPFRQTLATENVLRQAPAAFMDFTRRPTLVRQVWDSSPLYGWHEKFFFRSADGTVEYLVIRDAAGDVFVPSAHAVQATGGGAIRSWAFNTGGQTTTKFVHKGQGVADGLYEEVSNQIPAAYQQEYRLDQAFHTRLSRELEELLPERQLFDPSTMAINVPGMSVTVQIVPPGPSSLFTPSPTRGMMWGGRTAVDLAGGGSNPDATTAPTTGTVAVPPLPAPPPINWIADRYGFPTIYVPIGQAQPIGKPGTGGKEKEVGMAPFSFPGTTLEPATSRGKTRFAGTDYFKPTRVDYAFNGAAVGKAPIIDPMQTGGSGTDGQPAEVGGNPRGSGGRPHNAPLLRTEMAPLPQRPASSREATIYFTSLGRSTGDAFTMTVLNHRRDPIVIDTDALVLEPVTNVDQAAIAREIDRHPAVAKLTTTLKGYCLEFTKGAPVAGTIYRLASAGKQQQFERFQWILAATRRMRDFGFLPPDGGDPAAYVDSIRQWAIWIAEQRFDERQFGDAFVEHTRKNVVAAGRAWSREFEDAARQLVPGRWAAIQRVFADAARLETAARTR